MTDLIPTDAAPPAETGSNGFLALAARVTTLATAAWHLKEGMHQLQNRMETNATAARTVSEMCDAAEVETQYTAQILEVSGALTHVARASGETATAADTVETSARNLNSAHDAEYRGIYEVVNSSGVQQPKPGFNRVR